MRHQTYIVALLAVALFVPTTAQAHRPPLTLATADHYANQRANDTLANYLCDETGTNPDELCLSGFDIDPCERVSPSRATCDVSYTYTDDTYMDTIITVSSTRHGHVAVTETAATNPGD